MTLFTAVPEFKRGARCALVCALIALGLTGTVQAEESTEVACADGAAAEAIEARRSAFNAAIADEDAASIASVLAEDVLLITGTDSVLFSGRQAQVDLWSGDFQSDQRLVYVRTPECIQVSERFPIALERGHWRGQHQDGRPGAVRGAYSAKWRHDGEDWRLEAEIFMTAECDESICPEGEDGQ